MRIKKLRSVDSTNSYIKKYIPRGKNTVVCGAVQTGGKGTKGRSFLSGKGGVYLSALTFYEQVPASEAFRVMTHAAVAVCRTLETFGAQPEIKWANDVYLNGKKICGILIENKVEDGLLKYSIVGMGVNVSNDVSPIGDIAINLSEALKKRISPRKVRKELIRNLQNHDTIEDYRARMNMLGKEVLVTEGEKAYRATALDVLPDGRLKVMADTERLLSAAEVSLKLSEGV